MTRLVSLLIAAVAILVLPAAAQPPAGTQPTDLRIDDEHDCTQLTPQRASISGVTDGGQDVSLDVLVLLDVEGAAEVAQQRARAQTPQEVAAAEEAYDALVADARDLIDPAAQSYAELDVTLNFADFALFKPLDLDGQPRDRTTTEARDSQSIIDQAKAQVGGRRPAGIDVVYVLTDVDITSALGPGTAGQADCIGGVAWDDTAFAVGEISEEINLGLTFYREATAKIVAHEIGHLMGAHHHYQECGRGAVTEATAGGVGACSIMTNFVDTQAFPFSVLSSAVVRAHAVEFADG